MNEYTGYDVLFSILIISGMFLGFYLVMQMFNNMRRAVIVERRIAETLAYEFVTEGEENLELVWKRKTPWEKLTEGTALYRIGTLVILSFALLILGIQYKIENLVFMALTYLIGMSLVFLGMMILRNKQRAKFIENLPHAIEFMLRTVISGKSITEAFKLVVDTTDGTLRDAFEEIVDDVALGMSLQKAIVKAGDRTDVSEFRYFCIVIHIHLLTGGNIAELFESIINHLRDKKEIEDKIEAISSESKTSAYVMALLPIFALLAVTFLKPSYIEPVYTTSTGHNILIGALFSEILGIIVVNKIVRIEI